MAFKGLGLLLWFVFVHLAGIYLFTNGFLLSRLALPNLSNYGSYSTQATHRRALVLIIDALRFDFVSPTPPEPVSPYYHHILSLPSQLTAEQPDRSFLFDTYSDPPTATLQRIKAITTGSLPTFVDIGKNFGASSILEDSLIKQFELEGKKMAFMGDDTWVSVYPDSFHPNMTFPYDSFNVEDLHTVDEGVIRHLFPLLEDPSKPFDLLVGHFLGVDHVGHRLGPDHPMMRFKLTQMNSVLTRVVELLDDDTLLVVMGDHGMDRTGDHGGDGALETSAALWVYSKSSPLADPSAFSEIPTSLLTYTGTDRPHRQIQQIDLVPSLSLLLGMRIPFNNLGSIIPELFWSGDKSRLSQALKLNARQVMSYLEAYRSSSSGGELDGAWKTIQTAWAATESGDLDTLYSFNRLALETCRSLWAQFNPLLMGMGLALFAVGLYTAWGIYSSVAREIRKLDKWLDEQLPWALRGFAAGAVVGVGGHTLFGQHLPGIDALDCALFAAPLLSCMAFIARCHPELRLSTLYSLPIPLILHSLSFLSNSFTFWEDRMIPYLAMSSILPLVLTGLTAPTSRLRYRILGFSALFAACVRLMSISTVCREEQQPYCHVTFYSGQSAPPILVLALALPASLALPKIIDRFLSITKSNGGVFPSFSFLTLTPSLLLGTLCWIVEWADTVELLGEGWSHVLRALRTALAWVSVTASLVVGTRLWFFNPICLDIQFQQKAESGGQGQVSVMGYANAFGSPYLIFWLISFSLVYLTTQLTGQLVLVLATVALLAYLEVVDSCRDVLALQKAFESSNPSAALDLNANNMASPPVQFVEVVPVALLGLAGFYATGHQSTISSIQWKSAFVLSATVRYPFSPLTVILNSFGLLFLMGLAAPLLALWNRTPLPTVTDKKEVVGPSPSSQIQNESILASLGMMIYYAAIFFGTAVSAAVLRRHLMVWKVFAPRFMAAIIGLVTIDVAVVIGVGLGVLRVGNTIVRLLNVMHKQK